MPDAPNAEPEAPPSTIDAVKDAAAKALQDTRGQARLAIDQSREAARRTAESLDANPLGVVVGGLAVGALAAALIPRTDREKDLLAPVGRRINATALAAIAAAKERGKAELDSRGLTPDGLKDQANSLFEGLSKAASSAGTAAADAARAK